jgi:hypothetical protein
MSPVSAATHAVPARQTKNRNWRNSSKAKYQKFPCPIPKHTTIRVSYRQKVNTFSLTEFALFGGD